MGLGYPGGPAIEKAAKAGNQEAFDFPRVNFSDVPYDFSFSGLKTAVINTVHQLRIKGEPLPVEDISASFQKAVTDVLVDHTVSAAREIKTDTICIAGGVAANSLLRESMTERASEMNIRVLYPSMILCTDNAAMIASAGYYSFRNGRTADWRLNAIPSLKIGESG